MEKPPGRHNLSKRRKRRLSVPKKRSRKPPPLPNRKPPPPTTEDPPTQTEEKTIEENEDEQQEKQQLAKPANESNSNSDSDSDSNSDNDNVPEEEGEDDDENEIDEVIFQDHDDPIVTKENKDKQTYHLKRMAIAYLFLEVLGAPPESKWIELNVMATIKNRLDIPIGTKINTILRDIRRVLQYVPSSKRIIQDCNRVVQSLLTVHEAGGIVVEGLGDRSGRRKLTTAVDRRGGVQGQGGDGNGDGDGDDDDDDDDEQEKSRLWLHPDALMVANEMAAKND